MIKKLDIAVVDYDEICIAASNLLGIKWNSSGPYNATEDDCFEVVFPTIQECCGVLKGESRVYWRGYVEPQFEVTKDFILENYQRTNKDTDRYSYKRSQRYIPLMIILEFLKNQLPDSELIVVNHW
jgi:hypothetical protein